MFIKPYPTAPPHGNYLLLTDSLSALHTLSDTSTTHPLAQRILLSLHTLNSINTQVIFIWIPGHINLQKHDLVDLAAKRATELKNITDKTPLPAYDHKNYFRSLIHRSWNLAWKNQTNNKLRYIKTIPSLWASSIRESRREQIILTRLRVGHTRITHSYLLDPRLISPLPVPTAIMRS